MMDPIEPQYLKLMNDIGHIIDRAANGEQRPRKTGFVLLMFEFGAAGERMNYISNGKRQDVIVAMKEFIARFEGRMVDTPGQG